MMNLVQIQEMLKSAPDDQLSQMAMTPQADGPPPYLVVSEVQRRNSMRKGATMERVNGGQTTVMEDGLQKLAAARAGGMPQQGGGMPQQERREGPITGTGGPPQAFQSGGIVSGQQRFSSHSPYTSQLPRWVQELFAANMPQVGGSISPTVAKNLRDMGYDPEAFVGHGAEGGVYSPQWQGTPDIGVAPQEPSGWQVWDEMKRANAGSEEGIQGIAKSLMSGAGISSMGDEYYDESGTGIAHIDPFRFNPSRLPMGIPTEAPVQNFAAEDPLLSAVGANRPSDPLGNWGSGGGEPYAPTSFPAGYGPGLDNSAPGYGPGLEGGGVDYTKYKSVDPVMFSELVRMGYSPQEAGAKIASDFGLQVNAEDVPGKYMAPDIGQGAFEEFGDLIPSKQQIHDVLVKVAPDKFRSSGEMISPTDVPSQYILEDDPSIGSLSNSTPNVIESAVEEGIKEAGAAKGSTEKGEEIEVEAPAGSSSSGGGGGVSRETSDVDVLSSLFEGTDYLGQFEEQLRDYEGSAPDRTAEALMALGFGMAASDSPYFAQAFGQGGQQAMEALNRADEMEAEDRRMMLGIQGKLAEARQAEQMGNRELAARLYQHAQEMEIARKDLATKAAYYGSKGSNTSGLKFLNYKDALSFVLGENGTAGLDPAALQEAQQLAWELFVNQPGFDPSGYGTIEDEEALD